MKYAMSHLLLMLSNSKGKATQLLKFLEIRWDTHSKNQSSEKLSATLTARNYTAILQLCRNVMLKTESRRQFDHLRILDKGQVLAEGRQISLKFEASLLYIMNLRPTRATHIIGPCLQRKSHLINGTINVRRKK